MLDQQTPQALIQQAPCKSRSTTKDPDFNRLQKCFKCEDGSHGGCRFSGEHSSLHYRIAFIGVWLKSWTGIRTITYPEGFNNSSRVDVTFKYGEEVDPHFPKKFNRTMTTDIARRKLVRTNFLTSSAMY
jgi:hypothetical protein